MQIIVFDNDTIRQTTHKGEEYYSVLDVVRTLTKTTQPRQYWVKIKNRVYIQGEPIWLRLKLRAPDGKFYKTDCATRENMFRIAQEIPSPKVEPFKRWLAQLGEERLQEMVDPSKSIERGLNQYVKLGYGSEWITTRHKGIEVRQQITYDWGKRGITEGREFARLTDTMQPSRYWSQIKKRIFQSFDPA